MSSLVRLFVGLIGAVSFSSCDVGDSCCEYSDFTCNQLERSEYNVYFYYPSEAEEYLGVAKGLDQCGNAAHEFAASKNLIGNRDWGYICCLKAKGSECYEKHR